MKAPSLKHRKIVDGGPVPIHSEEDNCPVCNEFWRQMNRYQEALHWLQMWEAPHNVAWEASMPVDYTPHPLHGGEQQSTLLHAERAPDAPETQETAPNE